MIVGDIELVQNVEQDVREGYARVNRARGLEQFMRQPRHAGVALIIAGGPSLADGVAEIALRQQNGQRVWTVNNTYAYLKERGIQPDAHVFLDSREDVSAFLHPDPRVTYYLDIRCHSALFDKAAGCKIITYDLDRYATGPTVGLKALYLAAMGGSRDLHLFGFDSSYRDDQHHAYAQPLNDGENRCEITVAGRVFQCAPWMAKQADEFQHIARSLADQDCIVSVHGDGLLPFVAHQMTKAIPEPYYL